MPITTGHANGVDKPQRANGTPHTNGYPSSYAAKHNIASHFIGGNNLSTAAPSKVRDFVQAYDGHTVIKNVSLPELPATAPYLQADERYSGPHSQQWHRGGQDDPLGAQVGLRDVWR